MFKVVIRHHSQLQEIACEEQAVIGSKPGSTIVIADPLVSAEHLRIRQVGTRLFVKDLDSANGTYLGPEKVQGEWLMMPDEKLTVGTTTILAVVEKVEPTADKNTVFTVITGAAEILAPPPIPEEALGVSTELHVLPPPVPVPTAPPKLRLVVPPAVPTPPPVATTVTVVDIPAVPVEGKEVVATSTTTAATTTSVMSLATSTSEIATHAAEDVSKNFASPYIRALGYAVDGVFILLLTVGILVVVKWLPYQNLVKFLGPKIGEVLDSDIFLLATMKEKWWLVGGTLGMMHLLYFGAFAVFNDGRTIGKYVLGLSIVDFATGGPIAKSRLILRETLGRFIAMLPFGLGYLWALIRKGQGWHDKLARTHILLK